MLVGGGGYGSIVAVGRGVAVGGLVEVGSKVEINRGVEVAVYRTVGVIVAVGTGWVAKPVKQRYAQATCQAHSSSGVMGIAGSKAPVAA